tara:strand:+ start:3734 stop:4453 length:720 start_codon:yes stop_codon:yes gene_type:complete
MVKLLELFSGTGSVGKVCKKLGWEVVSVDMLLPADHQVDIMDFDYKQYDKDEFTYIWGSPPCVAYSKLKDCWLGQRLKDGQIFTKEQMDKDMVEADKLVKKTLEIIDYFNCKWWFMENPQTGKLKDREIIKGLNFYDVDYCKYCDWGYKKPTRIWTNRTDFIPLRCLKDCENMIVIPTDGAIRHDTKKPIKSQFRKLHSNQLCKSETLRALRNHDKGKGSNKLDRYRIPEKLIFSLFNK